MNNAISAWSLFHINKMHYLELDKIISTRINTQSQIVNDQSLNEKLNVEENAMEFKRGYVRNMIVQRLTAQRNIISELASREHYYIPVTTQDLLIEHTQDLSIAPTQRQITNSDFIAFQTYLPKSLVSASGAILKTKAKSSRPSVFSDYFLNSTDNTILGEEYYGYADAQVNINKDRPAYSNLPHLSDEVIEYLKDSGLN